jgi:hypothetical protein
MRTPKPKPKPCHIVEAILCLEGCESIYSAAEITDLCSQDYPVRRFNRVLPRRRSP